jgi:uncharacterized membrane protein
LLGGLLALLSATTFALNAVSVRRGVLTGSVFQAIAITVPITLPIFVLIAAASGNLPKLLLLPTRSILVLALSGIINFMVARFAFYKATKALGTNLTAPIEQGSLVVSLLGSIAILDDYLTPLRVFGIGLILLAPMLMLYSQRGRTPPSAGAFQPHYLEGVLWSILAVLAYGCASILIKLGIGTLGLGFGLVGGIVSFASATVCVGLIALLPGRWQHLRSMDPVSLRWFTFSGVMVGIAQASRYAALGIAPLSVVQPIQNLAVMLRFFFGWMINREHEVYGGPVVAATVMSLIGALALTLSAESVVALLPLPEALREALGWRWP